MSVPMYKDSMRTSSRKKKGPDCSGPFSSMCKFIELVGKPLHDLPTLEYGTPFHWNPLVSESGTKDASGNRSIRISVPAAGCRLHDAVAEILRRRCRPEGDAERKDDTARLRLTIRRPDVRLERLTDLRRDDLAQGVDRTVFLTREQVSCEIPRCTDRISVQNRRNEHRIRDTRSLR